MKRLLSILLLAPLAGLAATNVTTLGRHDDWTVHQPTNVFFIANSNSINAVILHPESGTNGVSTNGARVNDVLYFAGPRIDWTNFVVGAFSGDGLLVSNVHAATSDAVQPSGLSTYFGNVNGTFIGQFNGTFYPGVDGHLLINVYALFATNAGAAANSVYRIGTNVDIVAGTRTNLWWDFGLTNAYGEKYVYQSFLATNDVRFLGPTNCALDDMISLSVLASGGNRLVMFPTNLPHFRTNKTTLTGSFYTLTLTNGNELIFSARSNANTLSTIWDVFGQQ